MALWLAARPAPSSKAAEDLSRWCVAAMSTTTWATAGRRRSMSRFWLAMPERSQTEHLSWHNRADGGVDADSRSENVQIVTGHKTAAISLPHLTHQVFLGRFG